MKLLFILLPVLIIFGCFNKGENASNIAAPQKIINIGNFECTLPLFFNVKIDSNSGELNGILSAENMKIQYSIGLLPIAYFKFPEAQIESDTFGNFVRNISLQNNNGKTFTSLLIGNLETSNNFFGEERVYGLFMEANSESEKELSIILEIFKTVKPIYKENPTPEISPTLRI